MTLPQMQRAVMRFAQPIDVINRTVTTVDFEPSTTDEYRQVMATVQVADKSQLNISSIDWTLRYIKVHSVDEIIEGEIILYKGVNYKVVKGVGDFQDYGYSTVIGEQIK